MSGFTFQKATKEKAKLRLALFGPSGSGKTFTGLRIATGMSNKIAVIDTERGSASKYADRFTFDVLELPKNDIETYCQAIQAADQSGYDVLIIDSLSHAWQELLEEIDKLAYSKYQGNTWAAWSKGTPKQRALVDAILNFSGHVIATMRSKTEWTTSSDSNGKNKPVRVGLAPEQGKGIEYEFDMLMELSTNHVAEVIKDRTGKYQDKLIDKPSEEFGKELVAWLNSGEVKPKLTPPTNGNGHKPLVDAIIAEGGVPTASDQPKTEYKGKTAKLHQNTYPLLWTGKLIQVFVTSGKLNVPHLDGILQKLNLSFDTDIDTVISAVNDYAKENAQN
jgi:hypothetical protein